MHMKQDGDFDSDDERPRCVCKTCVFVFVFVYLQCVFVGVHWECTGLPLLRVFCIRQVRK